MTHKIERLEVEFNWARNRLFDKPCCEAFLMLCQADGQVLITNVQQKPKNKWRPLAMDTIELEKTGSKKLKLSAKEIMTIAEKLYTGGFTSYPRTETNKFPKEMNLRPLVEMQTPHQDWGDFANRVLQWGPNPRNGNKSDQAHPPIHPTKFTSTLQGNEKRVYELIVRHFLACVSRDAVGSETIVNATIGDEEFTATGLVILERNYLDVYPYERWTGKEIHHYEVGHTFQPTELCLHEGATSAPGMLTEADLISLMDKHGIGTDATHAEHIAKIKEREYIGVIDQGHLVPGLLGMGLVEGYEQMNLQLAQPQLRAGLEVDLKAICDGLKNPRDVLAEQIQKYKECYEIIAREAPSLDQALGQRFQAQPQAAPAQADIPIIRELFKCPKCRTNSMIIRAMKDNAGFYIGCQGFPECKNAIWLRSELKELTSLDESCQNCGGTNKKIKFKFAQTAKLAMVDENPAFSRIEGTHYITCLICDDALRRLLDIPIETVKYLGAIVGGGTRPVHQNQINNQRPNPRDPPARGFGTNAAPPARGFGTNAGPPPNQRGWGNNDDDDDDHNRPGGGGAVAVRSNNNSAGSNGWSNSGTSGAPSSRPNAFPTNTSNNSRSRTQSNSSWGSGGGSSNQGWGRGDDSANQGRSNGNTNGSDNTGRSNQGWQNNVPGPSTSSNRPPAKVNLSNLPNINCQCPNTLAKKLVTSKEGPNQGRPFYTCAERKCKFFKWADDAQPANNQSAHIQSASGSDNRSTGAAIKRKCGICRQEGHTKRNCPTLL